MNFWETEPRETVVNSAFNAMPKLVPHVIPKSDLVGASRHFLVMPFPSKQLVFTASNPSNLSFCSHSCPSSWVQKRPSWAQQHSSESVHDKGFHLRHIPTEFKPGFPKIRVFLRLPTADLFAREHSRRGQTSLFELRCDDFYIEDRRPFRNDEGAASDSPPDGAVNTHRPDDADDDDDYDGDAVAVAHAMLKVRCRLFEVSPKTMLPPSAVSFCRGLKQQDQRTDQEL